MRKTIVRVVLAVVILVMLAAGGGWLYLRSSIPHYTRGGEIAGLSSSVDIWRDSLGVPHLWAANEADLARATGWVHAQDRLWQMELFRRVADGRLAEVLGPGLVDSDRFLRTVGMGRAADASERLVDPESRTHLEAYAQGVNAWIEAHRGKLPPEFTVLRFTPEPWQVRNSLSIAKVMAWDLADWDIGLQQQRAVDKVGSERAKLLAPSYPDWGVTILGADGQWKGKGGKRPPATPGRVALGGPIPGFEIPARARELIESMSIAHASNSWVIGGSRTRSGKPILANDMHLSLRAPSVWYLAALHGGGINAAGMTIPGAPAVIAGHNDRVAWGYTNAMVDDVDFFVEEVDASDSTRYRTPDGSEPFAVREDTIRVKGGTTVVHRVKATRHGPVLSDVDRRGGNRVLAMRWTALDPTAEFRALLGFNRARTVQQFLEAAREFTNPHQNLIVADVDGTIAYWMGGHVPVRTSGDGVLPTPGWTKDGEWVRYLDFDEHPHVIDPADGFVVTANNRQVGADYPFMIGTNWFGPYRAMRIRAMVDSSRGLTTADVARQQMDRHDAHALRYLPNAIRAAEAAGDTTAARELRAWDGDMAADSRTAALFYLWYETLRRLVGADEYRGERMYFPREALDATLDAGGSLWVDDVTTADEVETLDELSVAAMREAVTTAQGRQWGDIHTSRIEHALGVSPALDRLLGLNTGPFGSGGSGTTVNVAGWSGTAPPFQSGYGPSQRHVVDLADIDGSSGFIIPGGTSGHPLSPHYRDQLSRWREGRLWIIPLDRAKAEPRAVAKTVLRPR